MVALVMCAPILGAQKQERAPAPLKQQADALIQDLTARGEALVELQKKAAASDGERRAIYRNELLRRWERFAVKLDELVKNLKEQEAKGIDPADQLESARALTAAVAAGLSDVVITREAALVKLEDKFADASGDERVTLDRQVRRESFVYQSLLKAIVDNIGRMNSLGVDPSSLAEQVDHLLRDRAQILDGRLRLLVEQRSNIKESQRRAVESDKSDIQKQLNTVQAQIDFWANALRSTLDLMDRRKIDTTEQREFLVKATGEVAPGTLDTKVAASLFQESLADARIWLRERGPRMVVRLGVVLLILLVFWFLSKVAAKIIGAAVRSSRLEFSKLLQDFFVTVGARAVLVVGLVVALAQLGLDLGPLLAGLGIAGFIVGFALQDSLSNFASGLMILVYRPYDVADAVEVAGVLGVVSEMSVVSTTIKTFDNQKLIVPNSKIWGNVIRNLTAEETRRVDMVFGISYGDDIAKAEAILKEEVAKHELVLKEPEPVIRVSELADSSVNFIVRPWTKTPNYWAVFWDLTRAVKLRFDAEGIRIPFPQRDVHMHKVE